MGSRKLQAVAYQPNRSRYPVVDCRPGFDGPYLRGPGDDEDVCGHCGHVLIKGAILAAMTLYLCCPRCGRYNLSDGESLAALG